MSDLSIEKQENNISFRFDYTSCWSCVHKHCTRIWCTFGGVYGVCHDWQFDFDRTFAMHWHVCAQGFSASWMRLCIAQLSWLYVAGSHRYFLITFDAKLNGMVDWFAGGWSASNTSRYWKSISSSIPSPVYFSLGLYFLH